MKPRSLSRTAPWAPTLLRFALGITFLWAGLGKWFGMVTLPASNAALLQEMGAIGPEAASASVTESEGVRVRRIWGLAVRIHESANPGLHAPQGNSGAATGAVGAGGLGAGRMALWPGFLGSVRMCVIQAWAVMICEAVLGIMALMGLFTRVCALLLGGVMLGAMWLDQIGPAMQAGNTALGILPRYPAFDPKPWMPILWQLGLLCSCLALVMLGSGRLAVDQIVAGWRQDDDHDEL